VSSGYFHAMGIALLRGRDFTAADIAEGHRVTVINEALAEQFWPNADPLGQQVFSVYHPDQVNVVVGVVGNVKDVALDAKSPPEIYAPYSYWNVMTLIVRGPLENSALIDAVRHNTAAIDPQVPVYNAAGLNDIVSHSIARQRFELFLLVLFAAIGLFLAAVGIFGLLAFAVSRRTHEIGVRLALGARPESVVGMLVGEGLRLLGMGAAIGIAAALALTRLMAGLLYNVSPADPLTYAAVVVTLTTVGAFACYLPARRALKVDPMVALRQE
jgi:putative ABC transport system permease protein